MNWYHIQSINQTVNLSLVTRIDWEAKGNTVTKLYFLETEYDASGEPQSSYVDISDRDDRMILRNRLINDTWAPPFNKKTKSSMTNTEKLKQALELINQLCELFPEDLALLDKLFSVKQTINDLLTTTN